MASHQLLRCIKAFIIWSVVLATWAIPAGANIGNYSRYDFIYHYNDGSGDYYTGYVFAPTSFQTSGPLLAVGTYLYDQPQEMWASGYQSLNGADYYITGITDGYDSSYDKKSYITSYYDADLQASLQVNTDGSSTASYVYVSDRTAAWESGYAISDSGNDTFSVYKKAHPPRSKGKSSDPECYAYAFELTYGDGDYYTGTVYAAPEYGYSTSYTKSTTDEKGNTDTYTITGVTTGQDVSKAGQVYVSSYYDAGSGKTYTPVSNGTAVGTSYLGSEHDYIVKSGVPEYLFGSSGSTFYEANLTSYAYAFKLTYGDGDYYTGTVYAAPEYGYSSSYTKTTTDEKGNTDTYTITGVTTGYDVSKAGQVYVTSYYDKGSGKTYTPVSNGTAVGTSYLGSEHDYIIQSGVSDYLFGSSGGIFYEADLVADPYAYAFKFTYGDGDYYTGTVYAAPEYGYSSSYTKSTTDEKGNTDTYTITGVTTGYDVSKAGQVYVTSYYDKGSGKTYTPVSNGTAVGTSYLGSEHDYIIKSGVPEYLFGSSGSTFYEADLTSYAYAFKFTYGDGDYYTGTVYAAPEYGYSTSYTKTTTDEKGNTDTYTITGVTTGYDVSKAGQVYVTSYYDKGSGKTYTPVSNGTAVGTSYLGSEHDYIIKSGVPEYLFGKSGGTFYEADLTSYAYAFKLNLWRWGLLHRHGLCGPGIRLLHPLYQDHHR